jgi:hypothetical protein
MTTHYISIFLNKVKPENIPELAYPITSTDTVLSYSTRSYNFGTFTEPFYKKEVEVFCETEEEFFDTVAKYQLMQLITS